MLKYTLVVLGSLCLLNLAVHASPTLQQGEQTNYKEEAGLGIGALIGGLIAGPPGAIIGAAGGAWYGNREKQEDSKVSQLQIDLASRQAELAALEQEFKQLQAAYGQELHRVKLEKDRNARQALSHGVSLSVYFRTDSVALDPAYVPRIRKLGKFIAAYPDIQIHLAAHADRRGTEQYNNTLSEKRARVIRELLLQTGLDGRRVHAHAYGEREATSAPGDVEGYIFDRRVDIQLTLDTQT